MSYPVEQPVAQRSNDKTKEIRRVALGSMAGTTIELFDFFLFGTAAALVFNEVFFPTLSPTAGTIASFALLSVAFIIRPIGAVVLGHFGDRVGRKRLLIFTLSLTGGSTFLIGVVPTPDTIGWFAPVLIIIFRVMQGIGVSGEWGGAVLVAVEHAPPGKRGFYGSFPQVGLAFGLLMATGSFALVSSLLTREQLVDWGWRLPFIASLPLLAVALFIRMKIAETPAFIEAQKQAKNVKSEKIPIHELLSNHWRPLLQAIGLRVGGDVLGYTVTTFSISYIVIHLGNERSHATSAIAIAAAVSVVAMLGAGYLSDRVNRKRIYVSGVILGIVFAFPYFWLLNTNSFVLIVIAIIIMYTFAGNVPYALQGTIYSEMFPTRVRYTGASVAYNTAGLLGGGIAPTVAAALLAWSGSSWPISVYLMIMLSLTLFSALKLKDRREQSLQDV